MKKYTAEHKKNIESIIDIPISSISIGQIITFNYKKSENNKNPIVLVLNNNFRGILHGLVIDYISLNKLKTLEKFIIKEARDKNNDDKSGFQLFLRKLSIENPNMFYDTTLKNFLKNTIKQNVYRTYKLNELKNVKSIIYKF